MDRREVLADLRAKRREAKNAMRAIIGKAKTEHRTVFNVAEEAEYSRIEADFCALDDRIEELEAQIRADEAASPIALKYAPKNSEGNSSVANNDISALPGHTRFSVKAEEIYRPSGECSYFRDLYRSQAKGDRDAMERLDRNNRIQFGESRAISTTTGAGGEFAPPAWLIDQYVALARPGRILADLAQYEALPPGVDTLNIPKINTGSTTAVQTTQNTQISNTDITSASVSSGVTTIAGQQVLSLQLIEQSPINMDSVVLEDLAADYARQLDLQCISGTGTNGQLNGVLTMSGTNSITFTSASPTLSQLYSKLAGAIQAVHTKRFLPPDVIIMTPSRWAWICAQADAQGRPMVVPDSGGAYNAVGNLGPVASQGYVGRMLGLPVVVDASLPQNQGTGNNQDVIIVARSSDWRLYESPIKAEVFQQTYANQMSALARLYAYSAWIPNRYPASTSIITGTGLVAPTF